MPDHTAAPVSVVLSYILMKQQSRKKKMEAKWLERLKWLALLTLRLPHVLDSARVISADRRHYLGGADTITFAYVGTTVENAGVFKNGYETMTYASVSIALSMTIC